MSKRTKVLEPNLFRENAIDLTCVALMLGAAIAFGANSCSRNPSLRSEDSQRIKTVEPEPRVPDTFYQPSIYDRRPDKYTEKIIVEDSVQGTFYQG